MRDEISSKPLNAIVSQPSSFLFSFFVCDDDDNDINVCQMSLQMPVGLLLLLGERYHVPNAAI